ncbi:hypothetical protein C1H46_038448 [Malus baccata]|uniref:Uncharacterized protein n=1 Tax=Malus baccata TaxID=106549 RepID=A0A540KP82_MALBA|nr:hypothetical protein C1H46_038448 [Malus baccata]
MQLASVVYLCQSSNTNTEAKRLSPLSSNRVLGSIKTEDAPTCHASGRGSP